MSTRLTGRCAQTWTWTGLTLHQREASSTACSEERQVLVLRQLSEGVGAKVLPLFLLSFSFFSPLTRPCPNSTCSWRSSNNAEQFLVVVGWNKASLFHFLLGWIFPSLVWHILSCHFLFQRVKREESFSCEKLVCDFGETCCEALLFRRSDTHHKMFVRGNKCF